MISKKKIVAFVIIALSLFILSTFSIPVLADAETGEIYVNSEPDEVKIYVDGEYSGETYYGTKTVYGISSGSHTLKLSASDYKDWSKSITVEASEETEIYAYLEPISTATPAPTPTPTPPEPTPTPVTPTPKVSPTPTPKLTPYPTPKITPKLTSTPTSTPPIIIATPASGTPAPTLIFTPTPTPTPPPVFTPTQTPSLTSIPSPSLLPLIPQKYIYILFIVLLLILLPSIIFYVRRNRKSSSSITIERAIYDPCKGDFIEGRLPRMKEWINRYDKGAYWFAISIQNNTDKEINDWDVEIKTSSALKIKEAKVEGIEERIPQESHLGIFKLSVSKAHGYTIPERGQRRVYFKLRAEKPKTTYEISGIFKSAITGNVPIRAKEFKYLCDAGSLKGAILEQPEAALEYVKTQVNYYSPAEVSAIVKGLDIVFEIGRICASRYPKRADVRSEVEKLKGYLENVEDKLGQSYNDFEMLVREMDAVLFEETVPEKYAEKIKRNSLSFPDDLLAKLQRQSIERGG